MSRTSTTTEILPITEDDAFLEHALRRASIPTLMMALVHLTGDTSLLDGAIRPGTAVMGEVDGGLTEDDKAAVRAQALDALRAHRDRGGTLPPPPSRDTIRRMMSFMVGQDVPDEYVPMMLEELALDGVDQRHVAWDGIAPETRARCLVAVIGAGMSGILTAIKLEQAGVPYVVLEKNDAVGGTWHENAYPGCRVDVANHFYCYSFAPNPGWSEFFSRRDEIKDYFERCTREFGVHDKIRFRTEVVSARWDDVRAVWTICTRDADGRDATFEANAIVSAVGQLNRPKIPEIAGLETFRGAKFHSARWRHDVDLTGKRVAVIGTGASGFQLVPEVAKVASRLLVFQRSPQWMSPNPRYHAAVSDEKRWLLEHVPFYGRWYRFLLFWPGSDGLMPSLVVDPAWPHQERSVNELNEMTRLYFTDYMKQQVGDDPELLAKVVPTYPPFGKRMLQDNGTWLSTLKRDNVELLTDRIREITPHGVRTDDGVEHPVDVIVFATGFHANRFLWPMEITGRHGVALRARWGEEPQAYLGITVPDFPNLFCLYGPGTNLAHAGSIIFHSECQVRYVMGCLAALLRGGHAAMDVKHSVHDAYYQRFDARHRQLVFSHPGTTSWYKNAAGKVTTTSPWRLVDYWGWTREPDLDDYELR
ncbi:NAD(P)/FAD-dependent oxidoreductase [Candidatus Binatia bacterium]|nr:NAD(P)/FAD-dependent oxidoreductase [Candidatus Binatia bacterium]